jgi:Zn-dependent peptidase ImmA (M78 family)
VAKAAPLSHEAIRSYAEMVGKHHEVYDDSGLADIDTLVKNLGGRIRYGDSKESLHVNKPGDFTIYLPQLTSARRDRFTLAHELGHYFLHYRYPATEGPESFGRGERNLEETQANVFASSLLMPADKFRSAWRETGGDKWEVGRRFQVSPRAAEVRAEVLRLI